MIKIDCESPTDLWLNLGRLLFRWNDPCAPDPFKDGTIDVRLSDRRFISVNNVFTVSQWPIEWTGRGLYKLVGYSDKGTKMTHLRDSYIDTKALEAMIEVLKEQGKSKKFYATGMNFIMGPWRKGGCLSSFHVVKKGNEWEIGIHGKIAEIPRKFVADLVMMADIIRLLPMINEEETVRVVFYYSAIYYSIIGLRAYVPALGRLVMDYQGIPVEEPRNYQVGVWKAIEAQWPMLKKKYGKECMDTGMYNHISRFTGELT